MLEGIDERLDGRVRHKNVKIAVLAGLGADQCIDPPSAGDDRGRPKTSQDVEHPDHVIEGGRHLVEFGRGPCSCRTTTRRIECPGSPGTPQHRLCVLVTEFSVGGAQAGETGVGGEGRLAAEVGVENSGAGRDLA